jgi:regulatory protein YycI of two-component signal transduction system YycFG
MSFIDWMNMNMIVDIAFLIFTIAIVWKFRQMQTKIELIEEDLKVTMRNPQAAKRLLKSRQ